MANLIINEAFNLFAGDDGPDNSKHLVVSGVSIPTLEEIVQSHHAGGAIGEVSVGGLGLKALEAGVKAKGWDPQVMSLFGVGSRRRIPWTMYNAARDKKTGRAIEIKIVLQGVMSKLSHDEARAGELFGHDYDIREIWHYSLHYDKKEKYFYDFLTSEWRVDGVSQNADVRSILRIPGTAA